MTTSNANFKSNEQAADSAKAKANSAFLDVFGPSQKQAQTQAQLSQNKQAFNVTGSTGQSKDRDGVKVLSEDVNKLFGNYRPVSRDIQAADRVSFDQKDLDAFKQQSKDRDGVKPQLSQDKKAFQQVFGPTGQGSTDRTAKFKDGISPRELSQINQADAQSSLAGRHQTDQAQLKSPTKPFQQVFGPTGQGSTDRTAKFNNKLSPREIAQLKATDEQHRLTGANSVDKSTQQSLAKINHAPNGKGKAAKGKEDDGPDFD